MEEIGVEVAERPLRENEVEEIKLTKQNDWTGVPNCVISQIISEEKEKKYYSAWCELFNLSLNIWSLLNPE